LVVLSRSRRPVNKQLCIYLPTPGTKETSMAHPVVHAEIRSEDPDATRRFFADLFGWKVASEGAFPGYTFIDTGVDGGTFVAISPRQAAEDEVLFFVAVEDVEATLARAEQLGGRIVQSAQHVPGTSFGVFADTQGHKVGVASNR
jgi:predicted enzyme related to lactoylglutathione lyase